MVGHEKKDYYTGVHVTSPKGMQDYDRANTKKKVCFLFSKDDGDAMVNCDDDDVSRIPLLAPSPPPPFVAKKSGPWENNFFL